MPPGARTTSWLRCREHRAGRMATGDPARPPTDPEKSPSMQIEVTTDRNVEGGGDLIRQVSARVESARTLGPGKDHKGGATIREGETR